MSCYHFNACGPNGCIPDYRGVELDTVEEARSLALQSARQLANELPSLCDYLEWRFEITDGDGHTVFTIPFSKAQE